MSPKNKTIEKLIQINLEAKEGYRTAAKNSNDSLLNTFLNDNAVKRKEFAEKLIKESKLTDVQPGIIADLHRVWIDLKTAPHKFHGKAVLKECERGEKHAIEVYKQAVEDTEIPKNLIGLVNQQKKEIELALKKIEDLKQQFVNEDGSKNRETPV